MEWRLNFIMLNTNKSITIRVDLINAHDYLDYITKYKCYLEIIHYYFNGYISLYHFKKMFLETEDKKYLEEVVRNLIENKWIGSISISNYNFLYLKRKATICLTENIKNGDLKVPTLRQVTRSLMLSEIHLNNCLVMPSIYKKIDMDTFLISEIEGVYTIAILDISKKNNEEIYKLIQVITLREELINKQLRIIFFSFGDRYTSLQKKLQYEKIRNLILISNHHYSNKEHLNLQVEAEELSILRFFNNKEPVL
jgi:hypothetical protein